MLFLPAQCFSLLSRSRSRVAQGSVHCQRKLVHRRPDPREESSSGASPGTIQMDACPQIFQVAGRWGLGTVCVRMPLPRCYVGQWLDRDE